MATQDSGKRSAGSSRAGPPRRLWLEVLHGWVTTVDHKKIGMMYIGYALFFLVVAGFEALLMRIQLAIPNNHFVSPEVFNGLFTMHGTTMVFFVGMPILFGFGNYLIPLMIGARDMAFPRLNAFSFWISAFGGLLLYYSYIGGSGLYGAGSAPDVGWFAYAPLTARVFSPGHSTDYWTLALLLTGIGTIGTALNIVATIISMRCPGMKMSRLPLLAWLYLVTSGLSFVAIGPLTAAQIMLLLDRYVGSHFFDTQAGGSAVLWMHFFWIFGHPEVYILVLPAFAFANEIIPVFSRKAIFGYPAMVAASVGIGFISLGVWAHHMFTVGLGAGENTFFTLATMVIAVPTGIKIFNWLATLWGGKIHFTVAMMFAIGFLFQFLIAGLTGIMLSVAPFDWQLGQLLLCGGALPLCPGWSDFVHDLLGVLLLVPEDDRAHAERADREVALLVILDRLSSDIRLYAHSRIAGNATSDLHVRGRPRLDDLELDCFQRRFFPGDCDGFVCVQHGAVLFQRSRLRGRIHGMPGRWSGRPHRLPQAITSRQFQQ